MTGSGPAGPGLPPRAPLDDVHRRLSAAGIAHALGASALLRALGLVDHVGDWDLTTDSGRADVEPLLADLHPFWHGASGVHADSKLVVHDAAVEVILQMAFATPRGVVRIPTWPCGLEFCGVPVGSPEAWVVAYTLLGRPAKADRLWAWLTAHGAAVDAVERMLREPLDPALASRLRALPTRQPEGP